MQSSVKRDKFERMCEFVLICINEGIEVASSMNDGIEATTHYCYDSAKVKLLSPRDEVIQSIMRIVYKDIDSEFAARFNGGTDEETHDAWRLIAKSVADEFATYVESELNKNIGEHRR